MGLEVSFILRENENSKSVHFPLPCFAKGNTRLSLFFSSGFYYYFYLLLFYLFILQSQNLRLSFYEHFYLVWWVQ